MGPLSSVKVIEIAGIGPGPFAAMMLSDMGADVLRIGRIGSDAPRSGAPAALMNRGRPSVGIDLKKPEGVEALLRLVEQADALVEGFRPGVMERLGLGPDACLARNPRLVYGRMTGWGQTGPMAMAAGHDINYIALSGVLRNFARRGEPPVPPLNLIGDFGGGGMLLAYGVVCGVLEARLSGMGQVIDAAMVDGAAVMTTMIYGLYAQGEWTDEPGTNRLDTGAHFYDVYETSDGKYVSVGALEPQFYAELLQRTGLADEQLPDQSDRDEWPKMKQRFTELFKTKTRDEWCSLLEGTDACVAPVLSLAEAHLHPQMKARSTFVEVDGVLQPAPAPRFSRTPGEVRTATGDDSSDPLLEWGFGASEIDALRRAGATG